MGNVDTRTFMLSEDVNGQSVKDLVLKIMNYNLFDEHMEQTTVKYVRQPIILIVNSFGGSVYDGFALVSAIDMSVTPIYTVCLGSAMSMGLIIFSSGHVRLIHELSTLMYHEVSCFMGGKLTELVIRTEEMQRLQNQYDYYMLERTKLPSEVMDDVKKSKDNFFMNAHDAVKYGIADNIISVGQQVTWTYDSQEEAV